MLPCIGMLKHKCSASQESEEGSFVESAASHVSAALESFDEAGRCTVRKGRGCISRIVFRPKDAGISRFFNLVSALL